MGGAKRRGVCSIDCALGEMHEDFKTLKEEVQRETQEVEKLSQVGQSSLLTSLSNLLGKKKELQDLEQTVRSHWENRKCGRRYVWEVVDHCGWGGGTDNGKEWPEAMESIADTFPRLAKGS